MRFFGRLGQRLGLVIPALAIILELNHAISLGQMLMLLLAAVCLFWIGRIIEGYSPS
jgi:ATP/ADP translocase